MRHKEFAERAAGHLEAVAERIEEHAAGEDSEAAARATEMRVAALIVRDESVAVSRSEVGSKGRPLPLEAQA